MSKFTQIVKSNKITAENLKLLYHEIKAFRNESNMKKTENLCAEIISLIVEYLIYGDKNDPKIFEVFCEYNFMNEFIFLNTLGSTIISIQIIQSFSILILNISKPITQYYIFSNNFINQIISQDCSKHDDEFLAYYINFIKSLSLKIDSNTIQFFFHEQHNSFLLIESSMRFHNHPDSMIKTTVRNIFLTILRLNYLPIYEYFAKLPAISYFPSLVINLRQLIIKLSQESMSEKCKKLNDINDDILDIILYLQDIFSIKIVKINNILINCLFYYIIFPLLIGSIISESNVFFFLKQSLINITISLYILTLLFKYIKDESFLNMLFTFIFFKKIDPKILDYIKNYPEFTNNYYEWNKKEGLRNISFANYISENFTENFIKSLIFQTNSIFPQILSIFKKFEKRSDDYSDDIFYINLLEDVLSNFDLLEFELMFDFHKNLSVATGENVGLRIQDYKKYSIMCLTENIYKKIIEKQESDFVLNECKDNILGYFRSKDDSLILLLSLLLNTVHKCNISKEVLSCGQLLKAKDFFACDLTTNNIIKDIFSNVDMSDIQMDTNSIKKSLKERNSSVPENQDFESQFYKKVDLSNVDEFEKDIISKNDENNLNNSKIINNSNIINDNVNDPNYIITEDYIYIKTDKSEEKTNKESLKKENVEKIIKHLIDNKNNSFQKNNAQINKEIVFNNNFFSTNFQKLKLQSEYDLTIVENLLNLLLVDPSFRTITLRLIIENLENLIIEGSIDNNHLNLFNKIYYTYISGIKQKILTNKQIRDCVYELFEIEWHNYKKDFNDITKLLITQTYVLVPFNLEDVISEYPSYLKMQKTEIDNFKKSLIIFMNLYNLRSKIYLLFENIQDNFPLNFGSTYYEIEMSISISKNSICKLKVESNKNWINAYMFIDQNYMVICTPHYLKEEYAIVKYKYAVRNLELQIDRSDPRVLNTIVKDKENLMEIKIYFDDVNKVNNIKRELEEIQMNSKSTEFILIVSYFDDLLNKYILDYNI